uniref:Uncharacterized protein n=1 Tax=Plectus sambesii TaxID=2011161 RepID=A0A914WB33_9BILA
MKSPFRRLCLGPSTMTAAASSFLLINLVILLMSSESDGRLVFSGPTPMRDQLPRLSDEQEQELQLLKDPDILLIDSGENAKRPVDVFRYSQLLDSLLERLEKVRQLRLRIKNAQVDKDSRADVNRLWEKALNN